MPRRLTLALLLALAGCPSRPAARQPARPRSTAAPPDAGPIDAGRSATATVGMADSPASQVTPSAPLTISEEGQVTFGENSARLSPAVMALLDRLAVMIRSSSGTILLQGHADRHERGTAVLSLERARTVRRYLVDRGVPPARLVAAGYATTRPVSEGENERERRQNRRVDLAGVEPE